MSDPFAELDSEVQALRNERQSEALKFFSDNTEHFIVKTVQALDKIEFSEADAAKLGIQSGTGQAEELLEAMRSGQTQDPNFSRGLVEYFLDKLGFPEKNEITEQLYDNAIDQMMHGQYTLPEAEIKLEVSEDVSLIKRELITNRDIVEGVTTRVAEEMDMKPEEVAQFIKNSTWGELGDMPEAQREAIEASIVHAVQEDFPGVYRSFTAFLNPMTEERIENQVIGRMNGVINGMRAQEPEVATPVIDGADQKLDLPGAKM